jgi:S1-C subfamily serine protease
VLARLVRVLPFLLLLLLESPRLHAGLADVVERIKPSVVAVGTYQKTRSPPFVFRGTGFAVDDGTLVATNAHVLPDLLQTDERETMMVLVHVPGAREPQAREAKAIAVDKEHDLALLRISGARLPVVTIGNPETARDGQSVAFTGFPLGNALGFHPVTHRGIIASRTPIAIPGATARQLDPRIVRSLKSGPFTLFQLDATAYPGHSGSPLYDADSGEVIGIVNMALVKGIKDAAVGQPSGISVAVPAHFLQDLLRGSR